jgi:hypothetical protein
MYFYAVSVSVNKYRSDLRGAEIASHPSWCIAPNADEARGRMLRLLHENAPISQGYYGHQAAVMLVEDDVILRMVDEIAKATPLPEHLL